MTPVASSRTIPDFNHPLEMLHACHGNILRQCSALRKLAARLTHESCNQQAQQAAQDILHYFDTTGELHHQDEELDLFPTLHTLAGPDQAQTEAMLERLSTEHIAIFAAWNELHTALQQLAKGVNTALPESLADQFIRSYTKHITFEEAELLPLAARLLSPQQIMRLGRNMAERRGMKFPPTAPT